MEKRGIFGNKVDNLIKAVVVGRSVIIPPAALVKLDFVIAIHRVSFKSYIANMSQ